MYGYQAPGGTAYRLRANREDEVITECGLKSWFNMYLFVHSLRLRCTPAVNTAKELLLQPWTARAIESESAKKQNESQ